MVMQPQQASRVIDSVEERLDCVECLVSIGRQVMCVKDPRLTCHFDVLSQGGNPGPCARVHLVG